MRKNGEEAAARILRPLSALLKKSLTIDERSHVDSDATSIPTSVPYLVLRSADGRAFTDPERQFLTEVFDLVRLVDENEARLYALEERISALQGENIELMTKNRLLSEISARDSLTGLYNRWYVMEKIDSEMNRALRHGSPMSLLMIDLDHFKEINDSFGHPAGDAVLKLVGQVLRDSCRVYDVPGRYGGEEFCIVLPETRINSTTVVAERIRNRLANTPLSVGNSSVVVTASIGVAGMDSVENEGVLSAGTLLERADRALYTAKHRGRNRIELWAPGSTNSH